MEPPLEPGTPPAFDWHHRAESPSLLYPDWFISEDFSSGLDVARVSHGAALVSQCVAQEDGIDT